MGRHKRQQPPPRYLYEARLGVFAEVPLAVAGKGEKLHRLAVGHCGHPAPEEGSVGRKPASALEKGLGLEFVWGVGCQRIKGGDISRS
jgi:hypothetical protein